MQEKGSNPTIFDKKAMYMEKPQTWCDLLKQVLRDPSERQRIAQVLGVSQVTLMRWIKQTSTPRPQNMQNLLAALPEHRELLLKLIPDELKYVSQGLGEETCEEDVVIPAVFYARLLHTKAIVSEHLLFSLTCDQILQQFLKQLDPCRSGMAAFVLSCMSPSDGDKVRSLFQCVGRGVAPWEYILDQRVMFAGIESLAGRSVSSGHIAMSQRLAPEDCIVSSCGDGWERSAIAVPIMHIGRIAGSLLVFSTLSDYFTPTRCTLIEHYAELLALAFAHKDFYRSEQIELRVMPPFEVQQPLLAQFRTRVNQAMVRTAGASQPLTAQQVEQEIWYQLEGELSLLSCCGDFSRSLSK